MRSSRICAVIVVALAWVSPTFAAPPPKAVVELFTSQGCSSCPPADALLGELARRPDLVAVSLPVDYWDYLGWKDTLAKPAFSARQRAYGTARGDHQVYTPQMVVNGISACIGSNRAEIERLLQQGEARRGALGVPISVSETGLTLVVEVGAAASAAAASGEAWLMPVVRQRQVAIGRGENRGRAVTYVNVVRAITRLGAWSGQPARYEVPLATARAGEAEGYVILLQAGRAERPGLILGAAKSPGL